MGPFYLFVCLFVLDKPQTHYVAKGGHELLILLPLRLKYWDWCALYHIQFHARQVLYLLSDTTTSLLL